MLSNIKMPLGEAFMTSLIGILTVMVILAVIAVLILLVSKLIRTFEASASKRKNQDVPTDTAQVKGTPMPDGMNQGDVELIDTDEKTAAVIMAIVSQQSGIPLNRLSFKSISLKEGK